MSVSIDRINAQRSALVDVSRALSEAAAAGGGGGGVVDSIDCSLIET